MREWGGEVETRREGKGTAWSINKMTGQTGGQELRAQQAEVKSKNRGLVQGHGYLWVTSRGIFCNIGKEESRMIKEAAGYKEVR